MRKVPTMIWFWAVLIVCVFVGWAAVYPQNVYVNLNQAKDWVPVHDIGRLRPDEDGFRFEAIGEDPYIVSRALNFSCDKYKALVIEMSVSRGSQGQVFWSSHADGHFSEPASLHFTLTGDGQFHRYSLSLFNHPEWKGIIRRLRLDPADRKAEIRVRSFAVVDRLGPQIEVSGAHPGVPFAAPGESCVLKACFRNVGDSTAYLQIKRDASNGMSGLPDVEAKAVIAPGDEYRLEENHPAPVTADFEWTCAAESTSEPIQSGRFQQSVTAVALNEGNEAGILGTDLWRAVFYKGAITDPDVSTPVSPVRLQMKGERIFEDVAWMKDLGSVEYRTPDGSTGRAPLALMENLPVGENGTILYEENFTGLMDVRFRARVEMQAVEEPRSALRFRYTLKNEGAPLPLLRFTGPMLYAGEKSFGQTKDAALLPGIEYLDAEAVSSSDAVARPPVRDQYMPHPYKLTAPVMALTHEGRLISLLWPPEAPWAADERGLSPVFSVPNRLYGQANHLMGLFVPPAPSYSLENREEPGKPYEMKEGEEIGFECILYLTRSEDPIDAVRAWLDFYNQGNLPEPADSPRGYLDELAVSRQAYLTTCWDESAKGWGHCAGWKAYPSGGMLALLALDEMLASDEDVKKTLRERIDLVYRELVDKHGAGSLGEAAGCHVMLFEPAFFWGVAEQALPRYRQVAEGLIRSQNPDGGWGFHAGTDAQKTLGREGEVVSGTVAPNSSYLLRLARITGDENLTRAGLKSLEALNAFRVPRGSQGWECPIAAADILVSGYGARANLDSYRITGERRYLDKATYWARTGLAFHYLWNLPDRSLQRYATIPIFGTTFFTHSWLGVPVQWCGLVYAYNLLELAEFDDSTDWRTLARGIVNSGVHQQLVDGPYAGTLPDSYGDYFVTARGAYINPENILTNLHALEGHSMNIRTAFAEGPGIRALRVSANADVEMQERTSDGFRFRLEATSGRVTESVAAPMAQPPVSVSAAGRELPARESLFEEEEGWRYNPEQKALFIHTRREAGPTDVQVKSRVNAGVE